MFSQCITTANWRWGENYRAWDANVLQILPWVFSNWLQRTHSYGESGKSIRGTFGTACNSPRNVTQRSLIGICVSNGHFRVKSLSRTKQPCAVRRGEREGSHKERHCAATEQIRVNGTIRLVHFLQRFSRTRDSAASHGVDIEMSENALNCTWNKGRSYIYTRAAWLITVSSKSQCLWLWLLANLTSCNYWPLHTKSCILCTYESYKQVPNCM